MFEDVPEAAEAVSMQTVFPEVELAGEYPANLSYLAGLALGSISAGAASEINSLSGKFRVARNVFSHPHHWKEKLSGFWQIVWQRRKVIGLTSVGLVYGSLMLLFLFTVFVPQSVHFAFASSKNCVASPAFFPGLDHERPASVFQLSHRSTISIAHKPIFSYALCAVPTSKPLATTAYIDHQQFSFAGLHITKSIKVVTSSYPTIHSENFVAKNVPISKLLKFTITPLDATFDYALATNGQTSACLKQKTGLSCSLAPLKLAYSTNYDVRLVRLFHNQPAGNVTSQVLQTISATTITQASIAAGSVVYDTPQQVTLQTDKTLTALEHLVLTTKKPDGSTTDVPVTYKFSGQTITINITSPLARKTQFDLHLDNVTASDTSRLAQPYDLAFTTSGGPKVTDTSLASSDVVLGKSIVISFDQKLLPNEDPQQLVTFNVNGAKQQVSASIVNSQIIITPSGSLPLCAHLNLTVTGAAQNEYGVTGDSAWSFNSRARCYTTYNIGASVQGRGATAYQFGDGSNMVLYIGGTHGNEQNSTVILQKWFSELVANPDKIPAGRTVTVIPEINPDGIATNSRLNAHGIDLNRNFPANNWQTDVTEPGGGGAMTTDGGPQPLSEPESQALAAFVTTQRPRLVLTYHSHAGVVEANEAGDSVGLAAIYAAKAGYAATPTSQIGTTFDYSTTGAFEDWMHDKLGLPAFVIELQSPTADEFTRNRTAMWAMAQTP